MNKASSLSISIAKIHYKNAIKRFCERNWVLATNSDFQIAISLQPDSVNLWYLKLLLFELKWFIVWNIKGLWHAKYRDKEIRVWDKNSIPLNVFNFTTDFKF